MTFSKIAVVSGSNKGIGFAIGEILPTFTFSSGTGSCEFNVSRTKVVQFASSHSNIHGLLSMMVRC